MATVEELQRKHQDLLRAVNAVVEEINKAQAAENKEYRELAAVLHALHCRSNHTDACGWMYDPGDWTEYSRRKYLDWAKNLSASTASLVSIKELTAIIEIANNTAPR